MATIQFVGDAILFVGGQIAMDAACCCGGGTTVTVDCCEEALPTTLTVTIGSTCSDIDGTVVTVTWNGIYWEGLSAAITECNNYQLYVRISCAGSNFGIFWQVDGGGEEGHIEALTTNSCDPLSLSGSSTGETDSDIDALCGSCSGTYDYTYTVS